ncbi:MAG: hypothetical protein HY739_14635 [Desulfobacterales bacterium]|jgi:hypothetical protein|nr:hypothetical protein [Desulfobacterales bacterium]
MCEYYPISREDFCLAIADVRESVISRKLNIELGYMSEETHREVEQGYGEVRRMLSSLISKLGATSDL